MIAPPAPRWIAGSRDPVASERLAKELGVPPLVAELLVTRGFSDAAAAHRFLNPSLDHLHDPRKLPDYHRAAAAILGARERKELIFVHGDYDVDGITSAALLNRFLTRIGCEVHTHVPHRMREGYGIHRSAVEAAKEKGAKLFLTCDCGVAAHEQVEIAREAGMRVVVTDHHSIGHSLPDADAVVNAHRTDHDYPFHDLSGAGVAFKLCEGICRDLQFDVAHYHRAFLDLAALGTIADVMPLCDENRVIARFGLHRLAESKKAGIKALLREANIDPVPGKPLTTYDVGFRLGPRLNAAGRLEDAAIALQLLLESDDTKAMVLAKQIEAINSERKLEQLRVVEEAIAIVTENGADRRNVIVVGGDGWHPGILGIAASRLVDMFHRPAFVLTLDREKGVYKGSARSIPGFDLAGSMRLHPHLFVSGGGHAMAAGCAVEIGSLSQMADTLHDYAATVLKEEDLVPAVRADFEVDFAEVTPQSMAFLDSMEPFGLGNPEPVFIARKVNLAQILPTKNPLHVRLTLRCGEAPAVSAIAFGIGERLAALGAGKEAHLVFGARMEEYRGTRSLKWQVKDFIEA